ncbi:hypothetical protein GCM10011512_04850 [Tersicoccus solisilvae]|uniref:HTH arsR-type domain-containing protein n=1 Tax=Tersicoccus solisilvae TaxID=1882339 RepID=A0ABQ1NN01_9MICC|nr:metalloregulator ArsR/SmtB family transcription factor [Tersicoccus solisilvae]GGC81097.1 hypothetical protein GCM10011512_04850 [Tersicoccus solisilvae]
MTGLPLDADDAPEADGGKPASERRAPSAPVAPGARTAADVYGVLADPTRRRLLTALRGRERSVGDLVIELAVSQPTVSKHLRTLREGGLVRMRASGQRRLYSLRLEPLQEAARWLGEFTPAAAPAVLTGDAATEGTRRPPETPAVRSGEAGVVASTEADTASEDGSSPIGRTVGRAAGRAAEMIANIPRLRRRNGRY